MTVSHLLPEPYHRDSSLEHPEREASRTTPKHPPLIPHRTPSTQNPVKSEAQQNISLVYMVTRKKQKSQYHCIIL